MVSQQKWDAAGRERAPTGRLGGRDSCGCGGYTGPRLEPALRLVQAPPLSWGSVTMAQELSQAL